MKEDVCLHDQAVVPTISFAFGAGASLATSERSAWIQLP
jgi:hypothetical protein